MIIPFLLVKVFILFYLDIYLEGYANKKDPITLGFCYGWTFWPYYFLDSNIFICLGGFSFHGYYLGYVVVEFIVNLIS